MNKERAASYLASGVPMGQVASILGVSPGYISQLMKEEDFKLMITAFQGDLGATAEVAEDTIAKKYEGLEHQLVKAMGDALPNAELPAITRALEVVAARQDRAKVRSMPANHPVHAQNIGVTVNLMLPGHAIPAAPVIEMNSKSEVMAINGKAMSPMSSNAVEKLFKEKKAQREALEMVKEI